ncbi:MAG: hypothetical protein COB40_13425 [Marinosulfonomonas sp.]|nr:MAG: hypothetical protein COB40_13425 [Marinosulfonomonas sp.]
MGIAILLLGLLPLAFMPDFLGSDSDDQDENSDQQDPTTGVGNLLEEGGGNSDGANNWMPDILTPIDEDDIDDDDTQNPDENTILEPVIDDDEATPSDGEEGEVLKPVIEDDVAVSTRASDDPITPSANDDSEADEVVPNPQSNSQQPGDDAGRGPANIENFQVGQDVLTVSVDPDEDDGSLDLDVRPSNNGQDGLVFVGGKLVAIIKDAPNASAQDVFIEVGPGNN